MRSCLIPFACICFAFTACTYLPTYAYPHSSLPRVAEAEVARIRASASNDADASWRKSLELTSAVEEAVRRLAVAEADAAAAREKLSAETSSLQRRRAPRKF